MTLTQALDNLQRGRATEEELSLIANEAPARLRKLAELRTLRDAVTALLPDLRTSDDDCCVVCGEDIAHTPDCPVEPLLTAYARVSPRRVPGRPAGQRIAEDPTPEAREVLGLEPREPAAAPDPCDQHGGTTPEWAADCPVCQGVAVSAPQ